MASASATIYLVIGSSHFFSGPWSPRCVYDEGMVGALGIAGSGWRLHIYHGCTFRHAAIWYPPPSTSSPACCIPGHSWHSVQPPHHPQSYPPGTAAAGPLAGAHRDPSPGSGACREAAAKIWRPLAGSSPHYPSHSRQELKLAVSGWWGLL